MPTYDFTCSMCEDTITIVQAIDKKLTIPMCAKCGYKTVRSFGVSAIKFKGNGWASKEK